MGSNASERPSPPLIALSAAVEPARYGVWEETVDFVPHLYVSAVAGAGAGTVLLPPVPFEHVAVLAVAVLAVVDGLVLTGGADVGPRRYGAEAHKMTDSPREERDAWELALCRAALDIDLPVLAVCRGMQVLNVALGGTLHQHLPEIVGHGSHRATLGQMSANPVAIEPGTAVASVLGLHAQGLCHHHQAVDRLGHGARAVGRAPDGTIEAIEVDGCSFAIGVQWHPEEAPEDSRLFAALAAAAGRYRRAKAAKGTAGASPMAGR